jgi:SHS2 domain-containing protein
MPEAGSEGSQPVAHTADLALRVWAPDLEGLFRQAALGLLRLLADPGRVRARETVRVSVAGMDLEELMVSWLNEILYLSDAGGRRFVQVEDLRIEGSAGDHRLGALLRGEAFDPDRHAGGIGVKAATYHGLCIDPQARGGYDLTLVLDM